MNTNTINVAPSADFHLFVSAGASAWLWFAIAATVTLAIAIYVAGRKTPPDGKA